MVSSATGKAAVSTPFDSSEMVGHSSNGAARSDSRQTTTGPNIKSATGSQLPQPSDPPVNLASKEAINPKVREIRDLLMKPRDAAAMNRLKAKLEDMTLKDLISKEGLHKKHVEGLWEIARLNTYDDEKTMPLLSGTWNGKSWQISKGLLEKIISNPVKWPPGVQDLPVFPLEGTFKMTIVGPGYTATLEDNPAANPAFIIHENTQSCHLALESEVQKTSSSNEQIILYIRVVTADVLVGQVRKEHKKSSKAKEELWGEFLLVKDGK